MMRRTVCVAAGLFFGLLGCGEAAAPAVSSGGHDPGEAPALPDVPVPEVGDRTAHDDVAQQPDDTGPLARQCDAGDGCFLDKCIENAECQSGWCVDHMGEGVCTKPCQDVCPVGWKCKQVAATQPDVVYVCVSDHSNLCRPCAAGGDCKSPVGVEDVCVDYGAEGSFCGRACEDDSTCPWGFQCQDVATVDGIDTRQCVAETGVCPCTAKSVALSLWTPCAVSNEWGACQGKRVCGANGLADCDAAAPQAEVCNGTDDDCDGGVDETALVEGKHVEPCDDKNPCTDDACLGQGGCQNTALDGGECIDGDPCTIADHCDAGTCVGEPVECDDDNPCTDDLCTVAGGCEFPPAVGPCDDGDPCTVADQCADGVCVGVSLPCECAVDEDCAPLEDDDLCNGTLVCDTTQLPFKCAVLAESVVSCPGPEADDVPCLQAHCAPATGACSLVPANEGKPCDDGDACTVTEQCADGACAGGSAVNCNDGNPCTDDACDDATGCTHAANSLGCSDGDVCTVGDTCSGGQCAAGGALDCDDGNGCTVDSCSAEIGCVHEAGEGACEDGSAGTGGVVWGGGACQPGAALVCDDNNPCTKDACDKDSGCVTSAIEGGCTDDNACTVNDYCAAGACVPGGVAGCNDGDVCTADQCDPVTGCVHTPNTAPCDDSNICTSGEACLAGECTGGAPLSCDDDNVCTVDSCSLDSGCVHQKLDGYVEVAGCSDACNGCSGGQCIPLPSGAADDKGAQTCGDSSGTCERCLQGQCTHQAVGQDLWDECATAAAPAAGSCRADVCSGVSLACGSLPEGEQGQPACSLCPGDSFDPVSVGDNEQDVDGDALCSGVCKACQGGACGNALVGTDPGDQCEAGTEQQEGGAPAFCQARTRDGKCDGAGVCNDFGAWASVNGGEQCSDTPFCDGDIYYAGATCLDGKCSQGTVAVGCCGDSACAQSENCDLTTNKCVPDGPPCQGWLYDGYCWYYDSDSSYENTCTELCNKHGAECVLAGRIKEASNPDCTVCRHWFPGKTCSFALHDEEAKPCTYTTQKCEYASYSPGKSTCGGPKFGTNTRRFCSCTF